MTLRVSHPDFARLLVLIAAGGLLATSGDAHAQDSAAGGQFGSALIPQGEAVQGQTIYSVEIEIASASGDDAADAAAAEAVRSAVQGLIGREYSLQLINGTLAEFSSNGTVAAIRHRPDYDGSQGTLGVRIILDFAADEAKQVAAEKARVSFPLLHEDDRSKLTLIATTGLGVYSDGNAWFGNPQLFNANNPLAGELPGDSSVWVEASAEFGIGGITRIADSDFYVFGAVSALASASRGQDIFTEESREFLDVERGYAGLLYADKQSGDSAKLTLGRQTWTLNNGFLISMVSGSSNAGERGATYLGPRNSSDFSAVFNGEFGRGRISLFYIDPNELEQLESDTTFAGVNLGYQLSNRLSVDASLITIPNSKSLYRIPGGGTLAREGTTTYGLHVLWRPNSPDHAWIETEAYLQSNSNHDMDAHAAYGTIGYIFGDRKWKPSLSYRYATFSGDDPTSPEFERFDSLMSTGLGNWLQGMNFGKVYRNGNLNTHRIQGNIAPQPGMNFTVTYHRLRADELNNLGANPALSQLRARDLGEELTASLRWAIDRRNYLQVVTSRANPGDALERIGATKSWMTLQASLYVNF